MNNILLDISITAIITAVFKLLVPEEQCGKQIKLLISCFFIVMVMNVLRDNSFLIDFESIINSETNYNDYSVTFERQTADETANQLRKQIKAHLSSENIFPQKIYIDINILEGNSISISEIRLVFDDITDEKAERAVRMTEECVGDEIKVTLEEG